MRLSSWYDMKTILKLCEFFSAIKSLKLRETNSLTASTCMTPAGMRMKISIRYNVISHRYSVGYEILC